YPRRVRRTNGFSDAGRPIFNVSATVVCGGARKKGGFLGGGGRGGFEFLHREGNQTTLSLPDETSPPRLPSLILQPRSDTVCHQPEHALGPEILRVLLTERRRDSPCVVYKTACRRRCPT